MEKTSTLIDNETWVDNNIPIGGGNYVSIEELERDYNPAQIDYISSLKPTCLRGMLLCKAGTVYHFDCYAEDFQLWSPDYLKRLKELAS
jgi:hypothetical protein